MISSSESKPLYLQLAEALERQIEDGLGIDQQLPTEKELCEGYSLSRTTVRLALNELERRGRVYRIQGKGTFVAPAPVASLNTPLDYDFASHCEVADPAVISCELAGTQRPASLTELQPFGSTSQGEVCRVELCYRMGPVPVARESILVREAYLPSEERGSCEGIARCMAGLAERGAMVRERYKARRAYAAYERELVDSELAPLLLVTRYVYGREGELMAVVSRLVATDRVAYQNLVFATGA